MNGRVEHEFEFSGQEGVRPLESQLIFLCILCKNQYTFAFGILNFGHCDLFGIWYLCFGISGLSGLGFKMDKYIGVSPVNFRSVFHPA